MLVTVFSNYTGHGIEHSEAVSNYMYELSFSGEKLSELELTVIIYAALLLSLPPII